MFCPMVDSVRCARVVDKPPDALRYTLLLFYRRFGQLVRRNE